MSVYIPIFEKNAKRAIEWREFEFSGIIFTSPVLSLDEVQTHFKSTLSQDPGTRYQDEELYQILNFPIKLTEIFVEI